MTGFGTLLRAFLRRDRWVAPLWVVALVAVFWSQASSIEAAYPTQADLDGLAASLAGNPALTAMAGPARGLDTVGGVVAWKAAAFGAVMAGLMSMFLIGRHTRAEEESGREELLRSGVVGRQASLVASAMIAMVANLVAGVGVAVALLATGLDGAGSAVLGGGLALCGLVFVGVALLAAQLTESTRAMYGLVGVVIGVTWGLRAVGDVGASWLSWLTPIGWYQAMRPFDDERWWPALLLVATAGIASAAAIAVLARRDIGSGIIAARPGPAAGRLDGWRLAWRLQRASLLAWGAGVLAMAVAFGSIGDGVNGLVGDSEVASKIFHGGAGAVSDAFFSTAVVMLALLVSGYSVMSALRPHGEEEAGRLELLLSTGLSRRRWVASHVVPTVAGTGLLLLVAGLGLGVTLGVVTSDAHATLRFVLPALACWPAVLVLTAVARLLTGVVPAVAVVAWLGLAFCVVVEFFGAVLDLPGWVEAVSPFHHLALAPAEDVRWWPVVGAAAVAGIVSFVGLQAFARRGVRQG